MVKNLDIGITQPLSRIGFYTLSDARAESISGTSPMMRGEILVTDRCNYACPYCRGLKAKGDIDFGIAVQTLVTWGNDHLKNVRFSGGEPTMYKRLGELVEIAKNLKVERIAVSTNGSRPWSIYEKLLSHGVNDFSVSLDACCAADAKRMAGGVDRWERVTSNLQRMSERCYTTVGIVLTQDNLDQAEKTIEFAHSLGVADIRVIPAAQESKSLSKLNISEATLSAHPILAYRIDRANRGCAIRGATDVQRCHLVKDDAAVSGHYHYPCVIYLRERGEPIGEVSTDMRKDRLAWFETHDPSRDKICSRNCLDVCIEFNQKCEAAQR